MLPQFRSSLRSNIKNEAMEHVRRKIHPQANENILSTFYHVAMDFEPSFIPYKLEADAVSINIIHFLFSYQIAKTLQLVFSLLSSDLHILRAMIYAIIGILMVLTYISYRTQQRYNSFRDTCIYYYWWIFMGLCLGRGILIVCI